VLAPPERAGPASLSTFSPPDPPVSSLPPAASGVRAGCPHTLLGPRWLIFRGVCAVMSLCAVVPWCRGARVQPGARRRPGDYDGGHRCRPGPGAPQPGSSQGALTCRPRKGRPGDSRHIAWLSAGPGLLCVIIPLIGGIMTHNIGKDHFPARFGEYFRGGRAGNARTGPAGAAGPAGTGRAVGRAAAGWDHAGDRAAQTPRGVPRNKPTGPSKGCNVPLTPFGFAGAGTEGTPIPPGQTVTRCRRAAGTLWETSWGYSSAGRASGLHPEGQGFESP
jgi:hypothetical protein